MALLALAEATGPSFDEAISEGLSWVAGANELGVDLRDRAAWNYLGFDRAKKPHYEILR